VCGRTTACCVPPRLSRLPRYGRRSRRRVLSRVARRETLHYALDSPPIMTTLTHYPNPADDAYQRAVASAHQKLNHAIVDTHKVRPPVSESWRRCLDLHHKPGRVTSPATISSETLAHYRTSHPLSLVVPMLETLLAPAHAVGLITAISNTEGHLLWVDGPRQTRA